MNLLKNILSELDAFMQVFVRIHPDEPEGRLMAADFYIESRTMIKLICNLKPILEKNQGNYPIYMQAILLANASSMNEELIEMSDRALGTVS